jgi:catechol 2,3-dioxygenase-like lactoylglutathione lyase family enzyme
MIEPGRNIAIKVPLYKWQETVAFYRDKMGLTVIHEQETSVAFGFGSMKLWIDRVDRQSQVDIWLEFFSDEPDDALAKLGSPLRDELEPLDGVQGHWTSDPAGTVLLVRRDDNAG